MKKRFIVDTNLFLRFLLRDSENQYKKSEEFFRRAKLGQIELIIPQIIIFEIVFALEKYYQFSKDKVVDLLKAILGAEYLKIQDQEVFDKALGIYAKRNVSFVDCFLLSQAQLREAGILSFDKELKD